MNICPWECNTCKQKPLCFESLRCCCRLCAGFMLEDFFSPAIFIALESPNWGLIEKGKREGSWCCKRGQVFLLSCSCCQGHLKWSATWENGLSLPEQQAEHRQTAFICCAAGLNIDSLDLLICHSLTAGFVCAGASPGAQSGEGKLQWSQRMENRRMMRPWKIQYESVGKMDSLEESNIAVLQERPHPHLYFCGFHPEATQASARKECFLCKYIEISVVPGSKTSFKSKLVFELQK